MYAQILKNHDNKSDENDNNKPAPSTTVNNVGKAYGKLQRLRSFFIQSGNVLRLCQSF